MSRQVHRSRYWGRVTAQASFLLQGLPLKPLFLMVFLAARDTSCKASRPPNPFGNYLLKRGEFAVSREALISESVSWIDQCQMVVTLRIYFRAMKDPRIAPAMPQTVALVCDARQSSSCSHCF